MPTILCDRLAQSFIHDVANEILIADDTALEAALESQDLSGEQRVLLPSVARPSYGLPMRSTPVSRFKHFIADVYRSFLQYITLYCIPCVNGNMGISSIMIIEPSLSTGY